MNRFDLEDAIQQCRNIVDDLNDVYEYIGDHPFFAGMDPAHSDKIANLLLGLTTLYDVKFEKLWHTFESCLKNGVFDATPATSDEVLKVPRVTRVEVIDQTGRNYVNTKAGNVDISFQDNGRTLKIFTRGDQDRGSTETL